MWVSHPSVTAQTEREFVFLFFTVHLYVIQSDIKAQRIRFLQRVMARKTNKQTSTCTVWARYVRWAAAGCLWVSTRNALHSLTHIKQALLASHMALVCGSSWPHSYVYFTGLPCSSLTIVVVFWSAQHFFSNPQFRHSVTTGQLQKWN